MKNHISITHSEKISGFVYGFRSPCFKIHIQYAFKNAQLLAEINQRIHEALLEKCEPLKQPDFLLNWTYLLGKHSNLPVFDMGKVFQNAQANQAVLFMPAPCIEPDSSLLLFGKLQQFVNTQSSASDTEIKHFIQQTIDSFRSNSRDTNSALFLKAAFQEGMCVFNRDGHRTLQYGLGAHSHLLNSSFTQHSSALSANIARSKSVTSFLLREAGLPVPQHYKINTLEEALKAAQKLGFPVVIKPANQEGGTGVYAALENADDIAHAFAQVKKLNDEILVEKHIYGKDYRLMVFENKLIWAIERAPAHVIGDGKSTVSHLIEQLNQQPERKLPWSSMIQIKITDDLKRVIQQQGLTLDSIPKENEKIYLSKKANISAGGTPIGVMEQVHPDNILLAERATRTLRLDLAGIDFLIPDISVSWKDSLCGICEVNAQPQLGSITSSHLYPIILNRLLPNKGHIPIHVIIGDSEFSKQVYTNLLQSLQSENLRCGSFIDGNIFLDDEQIHSNSHAHQAGKLLVMENTVDAIVMRVNDMSFKRLGLPFDRFTSLTLCELDSLHRLDKVEVSADERLEFLEMISPAANKIQMLGH